MKAKLTISIVLSLLVLCDSVFAATYTIGSDPLDNYASFAAFRAAHTETSGDTVSFRKGGTYRTSIAIPSSGVTYTAHGTGAAPIIQPTLQVSNWTLSSGNIYYATVDDDSNRISKPAVVMIGGVFCREAFWPTSIGNNPPVFEHPTADHTGWQKLLTDSNIDFDPTGAMCNYFGASDQYVTHHETVASWDNRTKTMTLANEITSAVTTSRYYLTGLVSFLTENTWAYDSSTGRLYVWKTGGGNPGTVEITTPASCSGTTPCQNGIYSLGKNNITVNGLNVRYCDADCINIAGSISTETPNITIQNCSSSYAGQSAIHLGGQSYKPFTSCVVSNNTVSYANANHKFLSRGAIFIYNDSSCQINSNNVSSSSTYPLLPGQGSGLEITCYNGTAEHPELTPSTISYNTISTIANAGIDTASNTPTISNNTIADDCIFFYDCGAIYRFRSPDGSSASTLNNTINQSRYGAGFGIYMDEGSQNITVQGNTIIGGSWAVVANSDRWASTGHIIQKNYLKGPWTYAGLGPHLTNATDTFYAYYNIVDCVNATSDGSLAFAHGNTNGAVIDYYNNVFTNCAIGIEENNVTNPPMIRYIKNNIFYNNTTHVKVFAGNVTTIDYNLYGGTGNWKIDSTTDITFPNWKADSSQDSHSINANPLFSNGSGSYSLASDFTLTSSSPAKDAGTNVGLSLDYAGHVVPQGSGVDIGVYEYVVGLPPSPPAKPTGLRIE